VVARAEQHEAARPAIASILALISSAFPPSSSDCLTTGSKLAQLPLERLGDFLERLSVPSRTWSTVKRGPFIA